MTVAGAASVPNRASLSAALLMVAAVGSFTILDSIMKHLSAEHPVLLLVWVRYLLQVVFFAMLIPVAGVDQVVRTHNIGLQVLRGLFLAGASVFVVLSLRYLPMAQTYAVSFSTPLIATAIAVPLLGERPSRVQWAAILAGFLGVVVALHPTGGTATTVLLLPLAMALSNAVYQVITRLGGRRDGSLTLTFHAGLSGVMWTSLALPWTFESLPPASLAWLLVGGLCGSLAQLLQIHALRMAPTAIVSPIGYSQLIWAAGIGYAVFGEIPGWLSLAGGAIVAASGIVLVRSKT
jgi:drug/metabolite transporter (DMT)-like permease